MADETAPLDAVNTGALDVRDATNAIVGLMDRDDPIPEADDGDNSEPEVLEFNEEGEDENAEPEYLQDDEPEASELADPDAEEADEQEVDEPPTWTVNAAGESVEVTEDELIRGYQRQRDYTRKSQEIAEARKSLESELAEARSERQRMAQMLDTFQAQQEAVPVPDEELRDIDPMEYLLQKERFESHQNRLRAAQEERQRLANAQQQEHERALQQMLVDENRKLVERVPAWKDDTVRKAETSQMMDYAQKELGYTADELSQIYDSRLVDALQRLWRYEQTASPKSTARRKVKKAPKTVKSGARRPSKQETQQMQKARRRLKSSGSVKDAAALLYQTLE